VDALRRNGTIEFVAVRHEEYGVFAAVAEAYFTGNPVVVCGTAGPGVVHLFNGLMDARKEGAPIIAIAGDVESSILDTSALEELNPYKFFETASLYTARGHQHRHRYGCSGKGADRYCHTWRYRGRQCSGRAHQLHHCGPSDPQTVGRRSRQIGEDDR
jgi:hypothetical protein